MSCTHNASMRPIPARSARFEVALSDGDRGWVPLGLGLLAAFRGPRNADETTSRYHRSLVPTLCVGMPSGTLCVPRARAGPIATTRSVADGIPTEDRGNEGERRAVAISEEFLFYGNK